MSDGHPSLSALPMYFPVDKQQVCWELPQGPLLCSDPVPCGLWPPQVLVEKTRDSENHFQVAPQLVIAESRRVVSWDFFRLKQNKTPECPGPGCLHNCPCARLLASMSVVFLGPVNTLFRPHSDGKPTLTLLSCLIKGKACSLPRSIIIWFLGVASTEEEGNAAGCL